MKPLLPRTDSYMLPFQLPVVSPLFLPSPSSQLPPSTSSSSFNTSSQKQSASRVAKRVRIAPKVTFWGKKKKKTVALLQNEMEKLDICDGN